MRKLIEQEQPLLDLLEQLVAGATRTTLRQMLRADRVRVNGEIERDAKRVLISGDTVDVGQKGSTHLLPPELSVEFEDDDLIVVSKASGLLTVATENEKERTAQAWLNGYLRDKGLKSRIHVVHRLDRDTSGVLVFAKNFPTREKLKESFAAHDIDRVYMAIVEGKLSPPSGTFRSLLEEDEDTYQVRSTQSVMRGKLAVTHYRTLSSSERYSLMEVTLETGRKNQIRVHFSEAGHPIAGDERYGAQTDPIRRLALHAHLLGFTHPVSGKKMTFTAPLPNGFRREVLVGKPPAKALSDPDRKT